MTNERGEEPMDHAACLVELSSGRTHNLHVHGTFTVGRDENANLPVADPTCSRRQFEILSEHGVYFLQPISESSPTYCNGVLVEKKEPLTTDSKIIAGATLFFFFFMPTSSSASEPRPGTIKLSDSLTLGRDPSVVDVPLHHVQVSRQHARITRLRDQVVLEDLGSTNGTFVRETRVTGPTLLQRGDSITIGPFVLTFTGNELELRRANNRFELHARNLICRTKSGRGAARCILNDVSVVVQPCEFLCVIGPSGSGKSTLLKALSARQPADEGAVLLNEQALYRHFEALKRNLAVVPQQDLLHESLTVHETLGYTARLRLPSDTGPEEIERVIESTLGMVGLAEQRNQAIHTLSGGQRKRACLANELLANPRLLFLDEVTSGLDEQADFEVMQLFREVAKQGKTVVCVTHNLANVESTADNILVLTRGGCTAFHGTPSEALAYFQVNRLGEIYERLNEKPAEHWQEMYRQSSTYLRSLSQRVGAGDYESALEQGTPAIAKTDDRGQLLPQFFVLTERYWKIFRADFNALAGMVSQCLLVALLIGLVFGDVQAVGDIEPAMRSMAISSKCRQVLFILAVSCLWFGCNNSAKEIVKERAIFIKERQVQLHPSSYLASKLAVLSALSVAQASVLLAIVQVYCRMPGAFHEAWLILAGLAITGVALGLLLSSLAPTEEFATTLVPMVLIPQIVLSGVFQPLEGWVKRLAEIVIPAYWAYGGLCSQLPAAWVPAEFAQDWSTATVVFALTLQCGCAILATWFVLRRIK